MLYALDQFGNLQNDILDKFTVTLTQINNPSNVVNGLVTPVSNGIFQVTYTLMIAGNYSMLILVQPGGAGPSYSISNSGAIAVC